MNRISGFGATLLFGAVLVSVTGCGAPDGPSDHAKSEQSGGEAARVRGEQREVTIEPKSDSGITGTATFAEDHGIVSLVIEIAGATPGEHAFHLHEIGDCSAPDGTSAGGHWNPTGADHGQWGTDPYHLGDVGNIVVGADGHGSYSMKSNVWSIGTGDPGDIVGRAIIVHAGVDDFTTQPTGAAGGRIGCGVIR